MSYDWVSHDTSLCNICFMTQKILMCYILPRFEIHQAVVGGGGLNKLKEVLITTIISNFLYRPVYSTL